jgi:hypothetical protein
MQDYDKKFEAALMSRNAPGLGARIIVEGEFGDAFVSLLGFVIRIEQASITVGCERLALPTFRAAQGSLKKPPCFGVTKVVNGRPECREDTTGILRLHGFTSPRPHTPPCRRPWSSRA